MNNQRNTVTVIYKMKRMVKSPQNPNNESRCIVPHAVMEVGIHKEAKVTPSTLMLGLPKYM